MTPSRDGHDEEPTRRHHIRQSFRLQSLPKRLANIAVRLQLELQYSTVPQSVTAKYSTAEGTTWTAIFSAQIFPLINHPLLPRYDHSATTYQHSICVVPYWPSRHHSKMPSQLHKVQKHIIKKKGSTKTKSLHENSRDARRLRRADNRDDRVSRVENLKQKANVRISQLTLVMPLDQVLTSQSPESSSFSRRCPPRTKTSHPNLSRMPPSTRSSHRTCPATKRRSMT